MKQLVIRLLILISLLPILGTFIVRWWWGLRILSSFKGKQVSCNLEKWESTLGENHIPNRAKTSLVDLADHLRDAALEDWRIREPKASVSRLGTKRFGMIAPPLTGVTVIFAVASGRLPFQWAIAIFLAATAFCAVISYLTIAPELKAILSTARRVRDRRVFARREDEDHVIIAARALAWKKAAPQIFQLLQK